MSWRHTWFFNRNYDKKSLISTISVFNNNLWSETKVEPQTQNYMVVYQDWGLLMRIGEEMFDREDEEEPKAVAAEFCIFSQAWNIPKHSHIFSFPITWVWLIVCSLHLRKILMYFPKYNLSRLPKQYRRISGCGQLRDPSNQIFWQAEGPKQSTIRYFGQLFLNFFDRLGCIF